MLLYTNSNCLSVINFDLDNRVDETAVDKIGVDKTAVDKIGVDSLPVIYVAIWEAGCTGSVEHTINSSTCFKLICVSRNKCNVGQRFVSEMFLETVCGRLCLSC